MDEKKMAQGVSLLLEGMGVNLADPNFVDTPKRVARMYREMLSPEKNSWTTFPAPASDLIILRGHRVVAICPHHLQPAVLICHIGYLPGKKTIGLSKLARAVEEQLTKPVLQEDLAEAVAMQIESHLEPKGTGVILVGRHGCMAFRGIESDGDVVVSAMKGVLLLNSTARSEFLQLVGRP